MMLIVLNSISDFLIQNQNLIEYFLISKLIFANINLDIDNNIKFSLEVY